MESATGMIGGSATLRTPGGAALRRDADSSRPTSCPTRRNAHGAFGATHEICAHCKARTRAVLEAHGGVGVQHAFVCVDPPATVLPAFRATARAGNVVVTALSPDGIAHVD